MLQDEQFDQDTPDRAGIEIEPRIRAKFVITFNDFTPLNDSLVGWLNSFLQARKEVKTVEYVTEGFNLAISEVADGLRTGNPAAFGPADEESGSAEW